MSGGEVDDPRLRRQRTNCACLGFGKAGQMRDGFPIMKIELKDVSKKYQALTALDKVSFAIEPGQIVALLGPNGAGKTTMLRCLAGIAAPSTGRVLYDGELFTRDRLDMRRRFSFLPDFPFVFENWTLIQHIGMVLRLHQADGPGIEEKVIELLVELDLLALADRPFQTLSRGQRYKGALAAMMAVDPEVWLLDEPFASGMDPHGISTFKRRSREAAARGRTVIYSTQILDAAERFSDRVCIIYRGTVAAFDSVANLRDASLPHEDVLESIFDLLREEENTK
jgi:ABC-2 type transport system ATP-binding protein